MDNQIEKQRKSPYYALGMAGILALSVLGTGCERVTALRQQYVASSPHAEYGQMLHVAGLDERGIGNDWLKTGRSILSEALPVSVPFQETGFLDPNGVSAVAYKMSLRRGEKVDISINAAFADSARLFIDLFRGSNTSTGGQSMRSVAHADSAQTNLQYEITRDGNYLIRVQPELLRGGLFTINIKTAGALTFPVSGVTGTAIRSFWGDNRNGGRRKHEGLDIFAERGTPVLATSAGLVNKVDYETVGGKVIWVRDVSRGFSIYYAHLDSQMVQEGTWVAAGDTIGLVGDTGNAQDMNPHLHLGVYVRNAGPIDPYPFVYTSNHSAPAMLADQANLGNWVRTAKAKAQLREAPTVNSMLVKEVPQYTAMKVVAGSGNWYHVVMPDGQNGYISAQMTESAGAPIRSKYVLTSAAVHDSPVYSAPVIDILNDESNVSVLGQFEDYLYVQSPSGRTGWMEMK